MPFDCPANDTLAALAKAEVYQQGGARWMRGYRPNPEGRKCLLAAVKWAMRRQRSRFIALRSFWPRQ